MRTERIRSKILVFIHLHASFICVCIHFIHQQRAFLCRILSEMTREIKTRNNIYLFGILLIPKYRLNDRKANRLRHKIQIIE